MSVERRHKTKLGPLYLRRIRQGTHSAYFYMIDRTPVICADELWYVMELEPEQRPLSLTLYADTQRPRGAAYVGIRAVPIGNYIWGDGMRSRWFSPTPALHLALNDITRHGRHDFFAWVMVHDADW